MNEWFKRKSTSKEKNSCNKSCNFDAEQKKPYFGPLNYDLTHSIDGSGSVLNVIYSIVPLASKHIDKDNNMRRCSQSLCLQQLQEQARNTS